MDKNQETERSLAEKETSMGTLIAWNISKALEKNSKLQLKSALKAAQERLECESLNVSAIASEPPDERHLSCALLAWHQLGHNNADSLYRFMESRLKEGKEDRTLQSKDNCTQDQSFITYKDSELIKDSTNSLTPPAGLVLKLPTEPKIVMRLDNVPRTNGNSQRMQKAGVDLQSKIEEACCLETGCMERLAQLDAQTKELRNRLKKLAKRESERVELLERAEAAWRDLELGYVRRHRAVVEKEEDLSRLTSKMINERTAYKDVCTKLVQQLKSRGETAEAERDKLKKIECEVCERACERHKQSEISANEDSLLADMQCKCTQLDRDLQFKEEQARRKQQNLETELESQRGLVFESERALRAELGGLKEQIKKVSKELLSEDTAIEKLKKELDELQKEKSEIVEDLDGCQLVCDKGMQKKMDELKSKREQLQQLKEKVLECKCKIPVDASVEVKRTPSLAALCLCRPEDRALESCSCTSLRSRLLSNLLSDLFSGLQSELSNTSTKMPCQLLKCLEDRHNWDKASVVKSNLRTFFAKLLVGELDIAIATSIEKYHAKWVGSSCVDLSRPIPDYDENEGWEERAMERRAHKMAVDMAEKMFQERADELVQKAKDVVTKGPPPCDCNPTKDAAVYPVFVKQPHVIKASAGITPARAAPAMAIPPVVPGKARVASNNCNFPYNYWQRAINDVTQLRSQIEELKKESIKKEDLRMMEMKITRLVQRASSPDPVEDVPSRDYKIMLPNKDVTNDISYKNHKIDINNTKKKNIGRKNITDESADKYSKKNFKRQYAVNMCFCDVPKNSFKTKPQESTDCFKNDGKKNWKQKPSKDIVCQMSSSIKQCKPISQLLTQEEKAIAEKEAPEKPSCGSECACFNKIPSCSSIDKLLETLTKWQNDLNNLGEVPKNLPNKEENVTNETNNDQGTKYNISKIDPPNFLLSNNLTIIRPISTPNTPPLNDTPKDFSKNNFVFKELMSENNSEDKNKMADIRIKNVDDKLANTESLYMGAVNLDKSNENFHKYLFEGSSEKNNDKMNASNIVIAPPQCIQSCKCTNTSIQIEDYKAESQLTEVKERIVNQNVLQKTFNDLKRFDNDINTKFESEAFYNPKDLDQKFIDNSASCNICDKINRASDAYKIVQDDIPCNCDYEIKFLGVTLSNSKSIKQLANETKSNDNLRNQLQTHDDRNYVGKLKCPINITQPLDKPDFLNTPISDSIITPLPKNTNYYPLQSPQCECQSNFDDLKSLLHKTLQKTINATDDSILTCNKTVNTSLVSETSTNKLENCVCCVANTPIDECSNLEENAFYLLQVHLKQRLKELKSNCQSSCIQSEVQSELISSVLEKIKQTILETTNRVKCKCSEGKYDESWQRAYLLLEEYLRTKISRIECSCSNVKNGELIIPDLTDKVLNLIENDFQRLKDICKCENSKLPINTLIKQAFLNQATVNEIKCKEMMTPNVITNNTAVQILPDTKSCEILAKSYSLMKNVEVQMQDLICPNIDNIYRTQAVGSLDVLAKQNNSSIEKNTPCEFFSLPKDLDDSEVISLKENNIIDQKYDVNEALTETTDVLPYIGYTIDCSCNHSLGTSCFCSKSIANENVLTINKLYKTYTNKNTENNKNVYIMQNVNKIIDSNLNYCDSQEKNCDDMAKVPLTEEKLLEKYDMNISVSGDEDIVLIDSRQNISNATHNSTNTVTEISSLTTGCLSKNPLDWYADALQSDPEPIKTKSVHFTDISEVIRSKSEIVSEDTTKPKQVMYSGCDCGMVPICHVKMLMDNIEHKLVNSKCTCDSLSYIVCPVHGKN